MGCAGLLDRVTDPTEARVIRQSPQDHVSVEQERGHPVSLR